MSGDREQNAMSNLIQFPIHREHDGGKARMLRRRERLGYSEPMSDVPHRHADPEEPYIAPPCDCA